jgi:biotin operon repressor
MRVDSNRELARQLGVSETAIRKAEKTGRIKKEPDGSWDLAKVKAAWGSNTDEAQQRGRMKPVSEAAVGAVRDTLKEQGEAVAAGAMTYMQARTANEVLKAQERRLKLQQIKGEVVDRAKAVAQPPLHRVDACPCLAHRHGGQRQHLRNDRSQPCW